MNDHIEIQIQRRLMLSDIERGRRDEEALINRADDLRKKANMIRNTTDAIVKKLAAFDAGLK